MILYLDTSALVKAYTDERHTPEVIDVITTATAAASRLIALQEAGSAFARMLREGLVGEPRWQSL